MIISNLELMEVVSENQLIEGGFSLDLKDVNALVAFQANTGAIVDGIDFAGDDLDSQNALVQQNVAALDD
jgi:hypothetical protein